MVYDITDNWLQLTETRGTFENRGFSDIVLENSAATPTDPDAGITLKAGESKFMEVSSGNVYAKCKYGGDVSKLAAVGFSATSTIPAVVPPSLTADVNKNIEDLKLLGAMTKADFEAFQEDRKRNNAGSGFQEWGKHYSNLEIINEGLAGYRSAFNNPQNSMFFGRDLTTSAVEGISRTGYPVAIVDGIEHSIEGIGYPSYNQILFPEAPDGTKSYDSATGVVTEHATSNEAFEGLVENGDFRNGTTGWSSIGSTLSVSNGVATCTATSTSSPRFETSLPSLPVGTYRIEIVAEQSVGTGGHAILWNSTDGESVRINLASGVKKYTIEATTTVVANNVLLHRTGNTIGNQIKVHSVSVMPSTEQVITSRQDLCFLETWHEKVTGTGSKDIVCARGNVQDASSTYEGISLVDLTSIGVGQGFSAFGEWDTATVGKGVKWSTLPDADKKIFLSKAENNIYLDESGELIQVRYRIRVVEGKGDLWESVTPNGALDTLSYENGAPKSQIRLRGKTDAHNSDYVVVNNSGREFEGYNRSSFPKETGLGVYYKNYNSASEGGERGVFAIPICLRQTLNQGAYHPVHNPSGCSTWYESGVGEGKWYLFDWGTRVTSQSQCFDFEIFSGRLTVNSANGSIASGISGRTDQYEFHDAIYAGQVKDLRLSANKQDTSKLLEDTIRKAVSGKTRGWGKVPFTLSPVSGSIIGFNSERFELDVIGLGLKNGSAWIYNATKNESRACYYYSANGYIYIKREGVKPKENSEYKDSDWIVRTDTTWTNGDNIFLMKVDWVSSQYDSLPWVDIIGDPERIQATFPNGVIGQWVPQIPDGTNVDYNMNRKANGTLVRTATLDDGVSWSSGTYTYDSVKNTFNGSWVGQYVVLWNYESLSDFTESSANSKIVGKVGNVYGTSTYQVNRANRLHPSLTGGIGKNSITASGTKHTINSTVEDLYWDGINIGELSIGAIANFPTHKAIDIGTPNNDSPAFKSLYTITEIDGLLYAQYHWKELFYDSSGTVGNEWGDTTPGTDYVNAYGSIPITDNESTMTDYNGNVVRYGTHHSMIPIAIMNYNDSSSS